MPLNRWLLVLLLGASSLYGACDDRAPPNPEGSQSPSAVASPPPVQRTGNRHGPIASTLRGPAQVALGQAAELEVQIDRRALHQRVTVEVQLVLPPEVVLERGALHTLVAPSSEAEARLRYVVRPLARSRQPLTVVIDAQGDGFGYHAELPYSFEGRAEPAASAPVRSAGPVRVGRRNFGHSVPVALTNE